MPTSLAALLLLCVSAFLFCAGFIFINEDLYRKVFAAFSKYFGVDVSKLPKSQAVPDALKPYIKQGKVAGFMFIALAIYITLTALALL